MEFFSLYVLKEGSDCLHKSRDIIIKQTSECCPHLASRAPCLVVDLSPLATQIGNPASAKGVICVTCFPNKILVYVLSSK